MASKTPQTSYSGGGEKIGASIDHICAELKLAPLVRERSRELASFLTPKDTNGNGSLVDVPESVANAVACAIVSIVHEEAWRLNRVPRHLPDRIIGRIYGLSSAAVVHNKHLVNSVITKKKREMQKDMPNKVRTR